MGLGNALSTEERPRHVIHSGPLSVADLRTRVSGGVLAAGDDGYDAARAGFNLLVDQRPAVIVVPEHAGDVAEAVRFARAGGLRVAIQATGHGIARPADDAMLIVTERIDGVTINPQARTAYVAAGARWANVLAPAQEHGLAPLVGSSSGVGAIGYTLGGGTGWLARRYGLSSDAVRSFDLVTPGGVGVRASAVGRRPSSSLSCSGHSRAAHPQHRRPSPPAHLHVHPRRQRGLTQPDLCGPWLE